MLCMLCILFFAVFVSYGYVYHRDIPALTHSFPTRSPPDREVAALFCVDTETISLEANRANLVGIAFAVEDGAGWYVPFAHDYLGVPPQLSRDVVLGKLKPLLEDAMRPKVGQNLKYDINV